HARGQAGVAEGVQLALDLDVDGRAGGQEHVRRVFLRHQLQEVADVHKRVLGSPGSVPVAVESRLQWLRRHAHPRVRLMTPSPEKIHHVLSVMALYALLAAPGARADELDRAMAVAERAVLAAEQAGPRGEAAQALEQARAQWL